MSLTWRELASPYSLALACFHSYQPAPHLKLISDHVGAMYRGDAPPILIVDAPPRHGKSQFISWAVPSHFLLNCPHGRVILASYSRDASKPWGLLVQETYQELGKPFNGFGLSRKTCSAHNWRTTASGGMKCVGRGGSLTSFGANLLILDDVIRDAREALSKSIREGLKAWWGSTVYNRLEPGALIILANTRWHEDDLTGYILSQAAKENGFAVTHLSLPAIARENDPLGREVGDALWPERYSLQDLKRIEGGMDDYWFRALYMGDPSNPTGTEFKSEYFDDVIVPEKHWPQSFSNTAMGVDPSRGVRTGDFQGVVWVGQNKEHLYVDSDIDRTDIPGLVERICQLSQAGCDGCLLESNSWQDLLEEPIEDAFSNGFVPFPIHPIRSIVDKKLRIRRLGFWLKRRFLRFRDTASNRLLIGQLKDFPLKGSHDDGPDALEMAVRMWKHLVLNTSPEDVEEDIIETIRA